MPKITFTPEEEAEAQAWFNSPAYEATKFNEVFTHVLHIEREIRHFDATALYRDIVHGKAPYHVFTLRITQSDYRRVSTENGIEEPRVQRLSYGACRKPILVAEFPDHKTVIIDGNHRIVRRYREGLGFCLAFFVEEPVWKNYLITMPRAVERLKVEDTINEQAIPHKERYGIKAPIDAYKTITG